MGVSTQHVVMTPTQFQEWSESRLQACGLRLDTRVPTFVKDAVTTMTEGLIRQVNALMEARATCDRKTVRLAMSASAVLARLRAQEMQTQERERQDAEQLELLRARVDPLWMGGGPFDPSRRRGSAGASGQRSSVPGTLCEAWRAR